jgi:hypothetical protein
MAGFLCRTSAPAERPRRGHPEDYFAFMQMKERTLENGWFFMQG